MTKPTGKELLALVGNQEAYALQSEDGSWRPVRERLTAAVIRRHREGEITVGTYVVNPPDQARTLVFDFDSDEAQDEMKAVVQVLIDLNVKHGNGKLSWAVENSGKKGYHVWVVAEDYMPATVLYQLGRGIREEAQLPKLEVFPKQTEVRDLGNLVKLPGGFHAVTRNPNDFVGAAPRPVPVELLTELASLYPEVGIRRRSGDAPTVVEYPCVHDIQDGVPEGGRNIHLFHLATMLRRFSINDENVEAIVRRANERGADGPLDDHEIAQLLDSSRWSGPICDQLDESMHCGDQCVKVRHTGLYTKAGKLKWAGDGEVVTVEVAGRTDGGATVELVHPDIIQGRAILAEPAKRKGKDDGA